MVVSPTLNQEEIPLASLPLLDYEISLPALDEIGKEHVFKLHYKSHAYFFRTDTQYSFVR